MEARPFTDEQIAAIRKDVARGNRVAAAYGPRTIDLACADQWLATLDARAAEVARLKSALEDIVAARKRCCDSLLNGWPYAMDDAQQAFEDAFREARVALASVSGAEGARDGR